MGEYYLVGSSAEVGLLMLSLSFVKRTSTATRGEAYCDPISKTPYPALPLFSLSLSLPPLLPLPSIGLYDPEQHLFSHTSLNEYLNVLHEAVSIPTCYQTLLDCIPADLCCPVISSNELVFPST